MNKWQSALSLAVVVLATTVVGWAWWNGAGPFRSRDRTPPGEYVNRMEGVEYVNASVSFSEFLDATSPKRWTQEQDKRVAWEGEKIQAYPPFVLDPVARSKASSLQQHREREAVFALARDFSRSLAKVVLEEGYRTLPYRTKDRKGVDRASVAQIHAAIKTSRQKNLVIFQSEMWLSRDIPTESTVFQYESAVSRKIRSRYRKDILQEIRWFGGISPVYIVDRKEALKAIESVLQRQAKDAFRNGHSAYATPVDDQYPLERNQEVTNDPLQSQFPPNR